MRSRLDTASIVQHNPTSKVDSKVDSGWVRTMNKLTALAVGKITKPGRYSDGGGLYLLVGPTGSKSWIFRYKINGRERVMGLGPFPDVLLADARVKAADCRRLRIESVDPLEIRNQERQQRLLEERGYTSFRDCAEAYVKLHEIAWRNPKHRQQWRSTLSTYVYPVIGDVAIAKLDVPNILDVLEPIWLSKPETASRIRGRLEVILDWAKVKNTREGDNPAAWKGNLSHALPKKSKVKKVIHHAALDYRALPDFFGKLTNNNTSTGLALQFLILTAARTGEVIFARWSEINLSEAIWTIPAERMKAGREHRVPLSGLARFVLANARQIGGESDYIFGGRFPGTPLSNMAMLELMRRDESEATPHGFRSTFRDWAAETTSFSGEVVEMALAHTIESKTEAAYRRGDLFAKRRELMAGWSEYIRPGFNDKTMFLAK